MLKHPLQNSHNPTGMERIHLILQQNQHYLEIIQQQLPTKLAEHCQHVVFKNNKLTLFTDSSIWASKLLYSRVKIIDAITSYFREPVHGLTVRVVNYSFITYKKKPFQANTNNPPSSGESKNQNKLDSAVNTLAAVLKNKNKLNSSR